ncbi:hypothetical protein [Actinomadura oligospora]|uniref:hypothetical protein n=1 Tax=Actinomadura oligospora TaxID=111804 RepID=UPI00047B70F6|nr:hypothetical protein [Actinomadura oligospora]
MKTEDPRSGSSTPGKMSVPPSSRRRMLPADPIARSTLDALAALGGLLLFPELALGAILLLVLVPVGGSAR